MRLYFTSKEVVAITNVPYRKLEYWLKIGVVKASKRHEVKRGVPRLFSFRDLVEISVVKDLTSRGLRVGRLVECINFIRTSVPDIESPLSSMKLVTDGRKIFKYVEKGAVLEELNNSGQFLFAFGLEDLIAHVVDKVSKCPVTIRYEKRKSA